MNRPQDRRADLTHPHTAKAIERRQRSWARSVRRFHERWEAEHEGDEPAPGTAAVLGDDADPFGLGAEPADAGTAGIPRDRYDAIETGFAAQLGLDLAGYRASADYVPY